MYPQNEYSINLVGPLFIAAAVVILLGALGGTGFERGVAAILVMQVQEVATVTLTSREGWVKLVVVALLPILLLVYAVAIGMMLAGMS